MWEHVCVVHNILMMEGQTYRLHSTKPVENNPNSGHFDKNGTITERVAKRCQPGINLKQKYIYMQEDEKIYFEHSVLSSQYNSYSLNYSPCCILQAI